MTVNITKPAINLREELTDLRNQEGYQEQQFYFDGLVTNGTFDTDTDWTKGTGWTISGGVAILSNTGSNGDLTQEISLKASRNYRVSFDLTRTDGDFDIFVGSQQVAVNLNQNQNYTFDFVATSDWNEFKVRVTSTTAGTIDNIYLFETDGTDVVHRMPKGWVPKDVFEDGLLQREGAANDYTVVYDGFDYYVKPAVAPSATTQTCVIGVKA